MGLGLAGVFTQGLGERAGGQTRHGGRAEDRDGLPERRRRCRRGHGGSPIGDGRLQVSAARIRYKGGPTYGLRVTGPTGQAPRTSPITCSRRRPATMGSSWRPVWMCSCMTASSRHRRPLGPRSTATQPSTWRPPTPIGATRANSCSFITIRIGPISRSTRWPPRWDTRREDGRSGSPQKATSSTSADERLCLDRRRYIELMSSYNWILLAVIFIGIPLAAWAGIRVLRDPHRK